MLSVIIPAFNESEGISDLLIYLNAELNGVDSEVIVVDGGSTDNTVQICEKHGAEVFVSDRKGRASQMNYGAQKAKGDVYYFLHADSFPPAQFSMDIFNQIESGVVAGCYQLDFSPTHPLLRLYAWFSRLNIDIFRFGDQSLFVTNDGFNEVGGFDERLTVMEDQKIVRDLKRIGVFSILNKKVTTSSRKYFQVGIVKLQLIFALILCLYYLGMKQSTLVNIYKKLAVY